MERPLNKELVQEVIDRMLPGTPNRDEFEKDLKEFIAKYDTKFVEERQGIRFYCETKSVVEHDTQG